MGERHQIRVRIPGPEALCVAERLTSGIEDAEFEIAGQIVADIVVKGAPKAQPDGSVEVAIEALTIAE
ncbi:MAG: hypothetical protein ABIQ32_08260 [Sphingomicrobium sp.]